MMGVGVRAAFAVGSGLLGFASAGVGAPVVPAVGVEALAVDSLVKVFRDSPKDFLAENKTDAVADLVRGGHYTFQVVVPAGTVDVKDLQATATAFQRVGPAETAAGAEPAWPVPRVRYVGYVGSSVSMDTTASDQLRAAPAVYPDPLLLKPPQSVHAGENQPVWVTGQVPLEAAPGDYVSTVTVSAMILGRATSATVPLRAKVYPVTIRDTRLDVTMWYQMWYFNGQKMPERYSDAWFDIIRTYAKNMREHRHTWGWVETHDAVKLSRGTDGRLHADFSDFDRWVELFFEEGFRHIEGQHFGSRIGGWLKPFGVWIREPDEDGKWQSRKVAPDSAEAETFFGEYFPLLQAHLEERGWLGKYTQHVADEPVNANWDSYTTAAMLLKKYAPKIRIMDATQSEKVAGVVDVWVPQLDHFAKGYEFFRKRAALGETVWMYTCMYPTGEYANRFVELPLIKTRLLHWINFRYGATGYLHWGYNYWPPHVWEDVADYRQQLLPGGDANIVYPDPERLEVLDSIRYEAMRDGIEDHELLSQLAEKDEAAAQELAGRIVKGFTSYETGGREFRKVRRELLERLSATMP